MPTPCATRWNSQFDCINAFLKRCGPVVDGKYQNIKVINDIAAHFDMRISAFNQPEIQLLADYCACLDPLARVLDILQGDRHQFIGIGVVLPLLERLKKKLMALDIPSMLPVREKIMSSLTERYKFPLFLNFKTFSLSLNLLILDLVNYETIKIFFWLQPSNRPSSSTG